MSHVKLVERVTEGAELVGQPRDVIVRQIQPSHVLGHSQLGGHLQQ